MSLFPPSVGIKDVKGLVFQDKNIVSFKKINLDIPLSSLISGDRKVNLTIENPIVKIADKISSFKKTGVKTNSKFTVNKINLKDGEFHFTSDKLSITLLKFNIFSYSREDAISFRIISPHLKIEYMLGKSEIVLEGNLESEFIKKEKVIKIREFRWGTKGLVINGNGNIYKRGNFALHIFSSGEMESILYPILKNLAPKGEMKGKTTIVKDTEGRILVNGNFSSPEVKISDEKFYNFHGLVRWNNRTKKVRVNSNVFWENSKTKLNVESKKGNTKISLTNISAAKAAKVVNVYKDVPLGGIINSSTLELKKGLLKGVVEIENKIKSTEEFNVNGSFDIEYHTKEKWIKFKTSNTKSEFGIVRSLSGRIDPKEKKLFLTLDGNINELKGTGKYLKKYVDLNLDQWGLEKGRGKVKIRVQKTGKNTKIRSTLLVKDFISNGVSLDGMIADINNLNGLTDIDLIINDNELKGKVNLKSKSGKLDFRFTDIKGESSSIFKILDINVGLKGRISGNFSYTSEKGMNFPIITGNYTGERLDFYDFVFKDVKGEIEVIDHIFLKNLSFKYHKGIGISNILIDYGKKYFEVDGKITAIDINDMNRGFTGKGDIMFSGKGNFLTDTIRIKYIFPEVAFYNNRPFQVEGEGEVSTDFSEYLIKIGGELNKKKISSPFTLSFGYGNNKYYGSFKFLLNDINIIMPWENNSGIMNLRGEINSDKSGQIIFQGVADLNGDYISFPGFPHTLDGFKGSLYFKDFDFTLRSFSGKMGGGDVSGNGMLSVDKGKLKDVLVTFNGKNMFLFPMERANFRMNANLTLKKRREKFVLGGAINFLSVLWEREVDEGISFYAGTSGTNSKKSDFLENLEFDISMNGKENIKVRNSFFTGDGELDLKLTGNKDFPILTGAVSSRNGFVLISGRKFDLIKARLVFNNNVNINPIVRLEAETFIKNYRIKFVISGLSSRIRPEFISSPSLPPQDIIALISLGELFQRSSSTNISSEVGTTGLVTTALTDQIQKRVKKLFGIDMLKLDPDPTRSSLEGVSRLTIGKSISKDFLIVYSTDISRSTRDVYFFQYQITPTITLIGKRNEEGRLSLDIRFRKRY